MDISLTSSLSKISPSFYPSSRSSPFSSQLSLEPNAFKLWRFPPNFGSQSRIFHWKSLLSCQKNRVVRATQSSNEAQNDSFVLEDVPHLTCFLPDLQVRVCLHLFSFNVGDYNCSLVCYVLLWHI